MAHSFQISSADHGWWGLWGCYRFFNCTCWLQSAEKWSPDLPGALTAWPTLKDQPMGCSRGLHMWHQKSVTALSGASLWSVYISCRRPPMTAVTLPTRVWLTCLGSTTSTRVPTLTEGFMLSVSWEKHVKMAASERSRSHFSLEDNWDNRLPLPWCRSQRGVCWPPPALTSDMLSSLRCLASHLCATETHTHTHTLTQLLYLLFVTLGPGRSPCGGTNSLLVMAHHPIVFTSPETRLHQKSWLLSCSKPSYRRRALYPRDKRSRSVEFLHQRLH